MINFKAILIVIMTVFTLSTSYAACFKGLECPDDVWTPIDRYKIKGGVVKDTATHLMWMRCSMGQQWIGSTCQAEAAEYEWEQAMNIPNPNGYKFDEYEDWRIPTLQELKTLVYCSSESPKKHNDTDEPCTGNFVHPTVLESVFPRTPLKWFWSSTDIEKRAGVVNFDTGTTYKSNKNYPRVVRLVRKYND